MYWQKQSPTPDNFTALLYQLITKADVINKHKLKHVFPEEYSAYIEWYESEDENQLFADWRAL